MHSWEVTPAEAIQLQHRLREKVRVTPLRRDIRYVAGCDVSANLYSNVIYAGFVVLSYPGLEMVDHAVVKTTTAFPYVPGLLSFREIPALLSAWKKLKIRPDVVIVDGQGIAHPRRLGIASHLGLALDAPTIGCAKSILVGQHRPLTRPGTMAKLIDPKTKEIIGTAFLSKKNSRPLIVSIGHRVTLADALRLVRTSLKGYRLPEPTRLAHLIMNDYRRKATASAERSISRDPRPRRS